VIGEKPARSFSTSSKQANVERVELVRIDWWTPAALIDHRSVYPPGHTGGPGRARVLVRRDSVAGFQALEDPGFRNMPGFAENGSRGRDLSQVSSRSTEKQPRRQATVIFRHGFPLPQYP
jgi:hypothetical protein